MDIDGATSSEAPTEYLIDDSNAAVTISPAVSARERHFQRYLVFKS